MNAPLPLRIAGVGIALPEQVVRSDELDARFGFAPGTIAERTGVRERRRIGSGDSNATLGATAVRAALAHAGRAPAEVDLILNASGTQQQLIPDGGPLLQRALGPELLGVAAFSIHATCLGFIVAPKAQLLLNSWKKVHVPFTVILTGFSIAHIYLSWSRAAW